MWPHPCPATSLKHLKAGAPSCIPCLARPAPVSRLLRYLSPLPTDPSVTCEAKPDQAWYAPVGHFAPKLLRTHCGVHSTSVPNSVAHVDNEDDDDGDNNNSNSIDKCLQQTSAASTQALTPYFSFPTTGAWIETPWWNCFGFSRHRCSHWATDASIPEGYAPLLLPSCQVPNRTLLHHQSPGKSERHLPWPTAAFMLDIPSTYNKFRTGGIYSAQVNIPSIPRAIYYHLRLFPQPHVYTKISMDQWSLHLFKSRHVVTPQRLVFDHPAPYVKCVCQNDIPWVVGTPGRFDSSIFVRPLLPFLLFFFGLCSLLFLSRRHQQIP